MRDDTHEEAGGLEWTVHELAGGESIAMICML